MGKIRQLVTVESIPRRKFYLTRCKSQRKIIPSSIGTHTDGSVVGNTEAAYLPHLDGAKITEDRQRFFTRPYTETTANRSIQVQFKRSQTAMPIPMCLFKFKEQSIPSNLKEISAHSKEATTRSGGYHSTFPVFSPSPFLKLSEHHHARTGMHDMRLTAEDHGPKLTRRSRDNIRSVIGSTSNESQIEMPPRKKNKRLRRRRTCALCPAFSYCCCFSIAMIIMLFLMSLAALLAFLLMTKRVATTSTTSTTTTSTTATTTTSTTTTHSSTTSSTSSTTSTSTTSQTKTTSSSTTSSSSTTATPTAPCTATSVGSASTLLSTSSGTGSAYSCFAYQWTSPTTGFVNLTFELRDDPDFWYLDNVSVYQGGTQMLVNGGFDTGSLSPWFTTNPYGACGYFPAAVTSSTPLSGSFCLGDGSYGCADRISQQFMATAGQVYVVSFWLRSGGSGPGISAVVTIT